MSQPHRLTDHVKVLHKVAIIVEEKVLLLKRHASAHSRPNQWDLPGGNAEWPEGVATELLEHLHRADVVREIQEETGIVVDPARIAQPVFFDTFFQNQTQMYTVAVGWYVQLDQVVPVTLSREHSESAWVDLATAATYDFGFGGGPDGFLVQIIQQAFAQRKES